MQHKEEFMQKITMANIKTCIRLEQELGLDRGSVRQIAQKADGTVEVMVDMDLDSIQKAKLEALFNMKITSDEAIL